MDRRLALVTGASAGIGAAPGAGAALSPMSAPAANELALPTRGPERPKKIAEATRLRSAVATPRIPAALAAREAPGPILETLTAHARSGDGLVHNAGYAL